MVRRLMAVDPGDVHVGVVLFEQDANGDWDCIEAYETTPDECSDRVAWMIVEGSLHTLVYERFRLYPDLAQEQQGSEFVTVQLIGAMRWLVRQQNEHADRHTRAEADGVVLSCLTGKSPVDCRGKIPKRLEICGQMADIQQPTRAILRRKGIKSASRRLKAGPHALSAELHAWYHLLHCK